MAKITSSQHTPTQRESFSFRKALLLLVPVVATVAVIWKFFLVVQVPFRLDYAEGFIFSNTLSVFHGMSMYTNVESAPYIFGFYTPLYNYIGAVFFKLFGSGVVVLRTLTFIFFVATGVGVAAIIKKKVKSTYAAVVAALLFYSAFIISQWSSIARPDMLGIFLISLGIVLGVAKRKNSFATIMLIAFVFSLAFFAKQSFVFAPLAFFISYLFTNKKEAWTFAASYACFLAIGIGLLHFLTHGAFTKQVFIYTSLAPYTNLHTAFRIAAITVISALPLLFVAIRNVFRDPKSFFSIYFLCSLLTFFMLLRDGGIQNYLLEFALALILLAITSVRWEKLEVVSAKRFYPLGFVVILFFVLWSFTSFPWETKTYVTERTSIFTEEVSVIGANARILVEDPLVAYATDSAVELDPYTFGQIVDSGDLSADELFSDMKKGTYQYVDDYGAFGRIPGFGEIITTHFQPTLQLQFPTPIKPFDYSLYNRQHVSDIGTLYTYVPETDGVED